MAAEAVARASTYARVRAVHGGHDLLVRLRSDPEQFFKLFVCVCVCVCVCVYGSVYSIDVCPLM
jgi:hypothetical protein